MTTRVSPPTKHCMKCGDEAGFAGSKPVYGHRDIETGDKPYPTTAWEWIDFECETCGYTVHVPTYENTERTAVA